MKKLIYRKSFLSMCAFITVCLFVFVYGFVSLAAESISLKTTYDIPSEVLDIDNPCIIDTDNLVDLDLYNNNYSSGFSSYDTWINFDSSSYVIYQYDNSSKIMGFLDMPDDCYLIKNSTELWLVCSETVLPDTRYIVSLFNNAGSYGSQFDSFSTTQTIDNVSTLVWKFSNSQFLYQTNLAIYDVDLESLNSFNSQEQLGRQVNPNFSGNMSDADKDLEHMNFDNAKLYYDVDRKFNGDVISCVSLDEHQINNPSEYSIVINTTCNFKYKTTPHGIVSNWTYYKGSFSGGYTRDLSVYTVSGNLGWYTIDIDEFTSYLKGNFQFSYDDDYYDDGVPLTLNALIHQFPEESISTRTANLNLGNGVNILSVPIAIDTSTCEWETFKFSTTFTFYKNGVECGTLRNDFDVLSGTQNSNSSFRKNNDVLTNVQKYNNDNNLSPGDTNYKDVSEYTSKYGVETNNNGGGVSLPSVNVSNGGSTSSPSVNVNTGGVVVNTGSGLVDPKPVVDYTKNELLPNTNDGGFVEKLDDATEGNTFINYLAESFTFLPASFWNDMSFYFSIFLGILVAGFVLRIVLDLL